MATEHSIFKIKGKLGDYVFYKLNGKTVVRRKAQKKKGPKSAAEQENTHRNSEFAQAVQAAKYFRAALGADYTAVGDRYLYQRINSLFLKIKNCDTAENGRRTVAGGLNTAEGRQLLSRFVFPRKGQALVRGAELESSGTECTLPVYAGTSEAFQVTELQIDLECGRFRRQAAETAFHPEDGTLRFKRVFRRRKGSTLFVLISEDGRLKAVVA